MEKFAVDLDKVLDEFELNEDEQDNSSQYDKLQLAFNQEDASSSAIISESSSFSFNETKHCNTFSETGKVNSSSLLCSENVASSNLGNIPQYVNGSDSNHVSLAFSKRDDSHSNIDHAGPSDPSQDSFTAETCSKDKEENVNFWPNLISGWEMMSENVVESSASESCKEFNSFEKANEISENIGDQNKVLVMNETEEDSRQLEQISSPQLLDVIPTDNKPSNSAILNLQDGQHPDILNLRHSSQSDLNGNSNFDTQHSSYILGEPSCDVLLRGNISLSSRSRNIQPESQGLLPDIMSNSVNDRDSNSASCFIGTINPAIVSENTSEPEIVQESQSNFSIPEIVNIHQTAEEGFKLPRNESSGEIISSNISEYSSHHFPVENDDHISEVVAVRSEGNCNLVKFDPYSVVDVSELENELEELEEEQSRVGDSNRSSLNQNTLLIAQNTEHNGNTDNDVETGEIVNQDHLESMEVESTLPTNDIVINEEEMQESLTSVNESASTFESESLIEEENENSATHLQAPAELNIHNKESSVQNRINGEDSSESESQNFSSGQMDQDSPFSDSFFNSSLTIPEPSPYVPSDYSGDSPEVSDEGIERSTSGAIGTVAPFWIPDEEAPNCQECAAKFTVLKRRHHCRGCGRVLCSPCCHFKAPLPYMDYKEARVCATCLHILSDVERGSNEGESRYSGRNPDPNNPMEYCSRIPPQQQVGSAAVGPPPTVMVPVGVLKRESSGSLGNARARTNKQVIFSDGIRPGGDLTESGRHAGSVLQIRERGRNAKRVLQNLTGKSNIVDGGGVSRAGKGVGLTKEGLVLRRSVSMDACLLPVSQEKLLPPILCRTSTGEYAFDTNPDTEKLEEQMRSIDEEPVIFALRKNVSVMVKLIKLDCCVGIEVWNVVTRGLCNVGQDELVILLEVQSGEKCPPPHLFAFLNTVYQEANKGNLVVEMGHSIFTEPDGFFGSKDHGGFLYVRPSYQCLQKLILPPRPYLFAILIQKWETPWAKVFPLRLMLRLGAEFRYYPCPLVSTRNRKSVYCEIGQTIMNLLVDFRNYSYTIPTIQGFLIHMEDKRTTLLIPRNMYQQITKALDNSNDHVLALCANFSPHADSHLVTVEDDDGRYTTQAINIHNKPRKITGASFVVFNGALKYNSGLKAKSSIVEDGLMVQISPEMMSNLRDSLRNMKDFEIPCGPSDSNSPDEVVLVTWTPDDKNFNLGVTSPIDGMQMDGVPSVKIHSGTDYMTNDYLIRWTEVFIIQGEATNSTNDINMSRLAEGLARAFCMAMTPHLGLLYDVWPTRLALRATIHQENVGYEAGMGGSQLAPLCMKELDGELVPVIHRAAAGVTDRPIVLELIFHIME